MTLGERYMSKSHLKFDDEMRRRFIYARHRMRLTQTDLGRMLGVSQHALSRLEAGHSRYTPFSVGRMRSIMRKHADFVMTGEGSENYPGYHPLKREGQKIDDFDV